MHGYTKLRAKPALLAPYGMLTPGWAIFEDMGEGSGEVLHMGKGGTSGGGYITVIQALPIHIQTGCPAVACRLGKSSGRADLMSALNTCLQTFPGLISS